MVVIRGLDPRIHLSLKESCEEDGWPGHPRSGRGQAPGHDEPGAFAGTTMEDGPPERGIQRPFISAHSNSVGVTCHGRTGRCHGTPRFSEARHWNCRRLRRAGDKRQGRAVGAAINCRRSTAGRTRTAGTASRGDQRGRSEPPAARTSTLGPSLAPPLASPLAPATLGLAPPALAPPLASPSLVNGRHAAGPP